MEKRSPFKLHARLRQKQHSGGMSAEVHSVQPSSVSFRKEMNSGIVQSNLLIRDLSQSTYLHQLELAFRWRTARTVTLDPRGAPTLLDNFLSDDDLTAILVLFFRRIGINSS